MIAEKVGRTGLSMVGISADGELTGELAAGALKNLSVSGRTLSADVAKDANKRWHVELTRDDVARGKISGMRLSLNGKLLLVQNAKWKNVGGAWYHERTDLTFYREGHVGLRQERSFSPIAILPGVPSDRSPASLTLVNDHSSSAQLSPVFADGSCPEYFPICEWFQAGVNPLPILGGVISELGGVIESVSGFLVGIEAGAASDPDVAVLAETVQFAMEAFNQPSVYNIAVAIGAAEAGGWTSGLFEEVVADIMGFVLDALMFQI